MDIIYISTPHNTHISYLRKALSAGKHVLCEKSITLNAEELEEAVRLAEEHHVVLAEAMTIFPHAHLQGASQPDGYRGIRGTSAFADELRKLQRV